jgi:hypothetical protein
MIEALYILNLTARHVRLSCNFLDRLIHRLLHHLQTLPEICAEIIPMTRLFCVTTLQA